MNAMFCIIAFAAVLTVVGGIADLIGIALGFIDPWDFR